MSLTLVWTKCEGGKWCPLMTVNLTHSHFAGLEGVYIIWHGGQNAKTVYVGQGLVSQRLAERRTDPRVLQYSHLGLFVTWAKVGAAQRGGVESYLAERLAPLVGEHHPSVPAVPVNLPW